MFPFIARRIAAGVIVLLGATFIVYMAVAFAADPLAALRTSTSPTRVQQMERITDLLSLDLPPVVRYFKWLGGAAGYLWGNGTLGMSVVNSQAVSAILGAAVPTTVKLVALSVLMAIVLGVVVGIATALRQYSAFDYLTTFVTFLFYSLPVFWVAVLLKEFGAIKFNDFLADPHIGLPTILAAACCVALIGTLVTGGRWRIRAFVGGIAFAATMAVLLYIDQTGWLLRPGLGIIGIAITGTCFAVAMVAISPGLGNRRGLGAGLTAVALGLAVYFPVQFALVRPTWLTIALLALTAVAAGIAIGWGWGGDDRRSGIRTGIVVALGMGALTFVDRVMQAWPAYVASPRVGGRPIGTIGAVTPSLGGNFWFATTDVVTHLVLPTTALVLISFASYTRYTRSSMLEVMNADYIRTARAKGLTERVVVVRHAFRNALIPLATVIPIDVAAVFGGAVLTERIFSWRGMGTMFLEALRAGDPGTVMGYFLVTAMLAIGANILADLVYAWLDPRIRVTS
ncbi:MAG: ABC transporter permease [Bifidobacteriaceae bacterium]|nr:ABC transporter permease [Bifidobacteriaceae bacterium]